MSTRTPPGRLLLLASGFAAACAGLGCSAEVTDAGARGECDGPATFAPGEPERVEITHPTSGVFIGDTLHLDARVEGEPRYVVLGVEPGGAARLASAPDAIAGPANLAPVAGGIHARVRAGEGGEAQIDVIDTSVPSSPAIVASVALPGVVDEGVVFSAADQRLFFCMQPAGEEKRQLFHVDLSVPSAPGEPVKIESFLCNLFSDMEMRFVAHGPTWLMWNVPTGNFVEQTYAYSLGASAATKVMDYGYNQTGVHQYGDVVVAATDGVRAVFDPENESQFLLVDELGGPNGGFAWAHLALPGPKRLLAVVASIAYIATPEGVRAYDIGDIESPELLPYQASIPFGDDLPRLVAASERALAVTNDSGAIYLVPLDVSGPVEPLAVRRAGEPSQRPSLCAE